MQEYNRESSNQGAKIFLQIEILNSVLNSCYACVCVKAFSVRQDIH
jgi:hypothetical protein